MSSQALSTFDIFTGSPTSLASVSPSLSTLLSTLFASQLCSSLPPTFFQREEDCFNLTEVFAFQKRAKRPRTSHVFRHMIHDDPEHVYM